MDNGQSDERAAAWDAAARGITRSILFVQEYIGLTGIDVIPNRSGDPNWNSIAQLRALDALIPVLRADPIARTAWPIFHHFTLELHRDWDSRPTGSHCLWIKAHQPEQFDLAFYLLLPTDEKRLFPCGISNIAETLETLRHWLTSPPYPAHPV